MRHVEAKVKNQYENYPYPRRAPEDEYRRLVITPTEQLDRLNYYCFSGRKIFDRNFRALVAGGGTGDALIMLAEQLREFGATVTYLDMSAASMEIAKQRAAVRQLNNIEWINTSLLDLSEPANGTFDYINCSGVLHHLEDPVQGLGALNSVLKDDGAMAIMVYAKYGRAGVYMMQELMRRINSNTPDTHYQVDNTKLMINDLPDTNIPVKLACNRFRIDIDTFGDIGVYDLFLHSQDRAYTIPQLYEFAGSQNLHVIQLFGDAHRKSNGLVLGNTAYEPAAHISNTVLLEQIRLLPLETQQAIAELAHGGFHKHTCYLSRQARPLQIYSDPDYVPAFSIYWTPDMINYCRRLALESQGSVVIREMGANNKPNSEISFKKSQHTCAILDCIDGKRTLGEIFATVAQSSSSGQPTYEQLTGEFETMFKRFKMHNRMFLRHRSVPLYATVEKMQARLKS